MDLRIDNHKLIFHPERVGKWLNGEKIYPILTEISLTSACNHRCIFCAPSFFLNYKPHYLDTEVLKRTIKNMAKIGVKAIVLAGEGEPLLHPDIIEIIEYISRCGIDVAVTTNGVLMDETFIYQCLEYLSWIKISVDADTDSIYEKIHRCKKGDLDKVFKNLEYAVKFKRNNNSKCIIGTQAILLKENIEDLSSLMVDMKEIGVDYLAIKPLSKHSLGTCKDLEEVEETDELEHKIGVFNIHSKKFKVIFRYDSFESLNRDKSYNKCYAQDFMAHIDSLGGVHSCINYLGDEEYCYGNINEDRFENIWKNKSFIQPDLDKCRTICRLDKINRYLWELKNPQEHVNFI